MGQDQRRRRGPARGGRDVEVAIGCSGRRSARGALRDLVAPQRRDLGPHQGTIDAVIAQHAQAGHVAAAFDIGIDEAMRQARQAVGLQVHRHEGEVAHHIRPAQRGAELEAVEHRRAAVMLGHVAEVQIAVAFAHEAVGPALREHAVQRSEGRGFPGGQRRKLLALGRRAAQRSERLQAVQHRRAHFGRLAKEGIGASHVGIAVQGQQGLGQRIDVRRLQGTARRQAVPQTVLCEGAHLQRPVERRPRTAEHRLRHAAGHGQHLEVERGRDAAVQAQLFVAIEAALRQRREVEEAQVHGLLDLERPGAGQ